ncbi:MAG: phospholipase [Bacteroidetes bacterium]|nr:MAG: phospholipase [Bacteroidota bacterium]
MPIKIGNIEFYMGPDNVNGPDNLQKTIINFIEGATDRLDIAIQELDNREIAKAIIKAKQNGIKVRIVLEADYLLAKSISSEPFTAKGPHERNRELHNAILRSKIKVNSDFNPKIFHQKFIIRDNSSILTGSTNFTDTGTNQNLNHVVIIHDKEIAKIYTKEYKEIQQGHFGKLNEGHDPKPNEIMVSNVRVKPLFAPDHNPEMEIMKQIAKAKKRVDFSIFTFAESSGIDDQMVFARNAGIDVKGSLYKSAANQKWSAKETLRNGNVEIFLVPKSGLQKPRPRKLHHKLMVIDEQLVIAGSFNYTGPANLLNDENILIIGDLDSVDQDSINKQKKIAEFALTEMNRIIDEYGVKE